MGQVTTPGHSCPIRHRTDVLAVAVAGGGGALVSLLTSLLLWFDKRNLLLIGKTNGLFHVLGFPVWAKMNLLSCFPWHWSEGLSLNRRCLLTVSSHCWFSVHFVATCITCFWMTETSASTMTSIFCFLFSSSFCKKSNSRCVPAFVDFLEMYVWL